MTIALLPPAAELPQPILAKRRRQISEVFSSDEDSLHQTHSHNDSASTSGMDTHVHSSDEDRHVHFVLAKNEYFWLPKPISNREWKRREQQQQKELNSQQSVTATVATNQCVPNIPVPSLSSSASLSILETEKSVKKTQKQKQKKKVTVRMHRTDPLSRQDTNAAKDKQKAVVLPSPIVKPEFGGAAKADASDTGADADGECEATAPPWRQRRNVSARAPSAGIRNN